MKEKELVTSESVALYLDSDDKHEATRREITELNAALAEYSKRQAEQKTDLTNVRARLEEGVSKTAFKAWEAAQQIQTAMARLEFRIEKLEENAKTVAREVGHRMDRNDRFNDRVTYGMLVVVFLSVFSAVMAFLWRYKP